MVICPGHVDNKRFNQAFKYEGWSSPGNYTQDELTYGYRREKKLKNGSRFIVCSPSHPDARKFTWTSWD